MSTSGTPASATKAKHELLTGGDPRWFGRSPLVESWRRSMPTLGTPEALREVPTVPESWLDDEPVHLLREPLESMAESLHDTKTAMLIADAKGIILARWFGDQLAARHLDSTGSIRTADLSEASVGTNAVGTTAATGLPTRVAGNEHFCDFFAHSACVAEPIREPWTGRVLAVLTLTCPMTARLDLLAGWGAAVRKHLEAHLRERTRRPESPRVDHTEEWALRQALAESAGDISRACQLLGVSRATVYRRMRRYRI